MFRAEKHLKTYEDKNLNDLNHTDSVEFRDTFAMLNATKRIMNKKLQAVSWFQYFWNYSIYQNYQKSIQALDEEIALMKDQDRVVSPEKVVHNRGEEFSDDCTSLSQPSDLIQEIDGKMYYRKEYLKQQLTHRDVFTRSRMPQSNFEELKRARE